VPQNNVEHGRAKEKIMEKGEWKKTEMKGERGERGEGARV
jgi:hypothetical protein